MRVPISYALHYPERADVEIPALDLAATGSLTFEPPDLDTFRCLALARRAGIAGGSAPCVLNAADEVAVAAFLADELPFAGIADVIEGSLDALGDEPIGHLAELFEVDARAREVAAGLVAAAGAPA